MIDSLGPFDVLAGRIPLLQSLDQDDDLAERLGHTLADVLRENNRLSRLLPAHLAHPLELQDCLRGDSMVGPYFDVVGVASLDNFIKVALDSPSIVAASVVVKGGFKQSAQRVL